ncbi:helical backbone metal receptor, partial [Nonomuraea fuscirosea]
MDDLGVPVQIPETVSRIVSLVPSLTESVAATLPGALVGATDWCSHPADLDVARVRGTKNPDLDAIRRLRPDVVLANAEENRAPDIEALRESGIAVWVTKIETVAEAFASLERMFALACRTEPPGW